VQGVKAFLICPDLTEADGPYPNVFYSNVSNFTQSLNEVFWLAKFDEDCWNYHMIPIHSRAVSILPSETKKNGKIVSYYFAVLAIILPLI